ncbi:RDD family protein [Candidatus Poriferisodalis sp.]|uniref:RDD family protein n=1 Tax=Candidatus Poriferisodalis sp. TaxID=3101277 RepID=UPI003B0152CF
MRPAGIERRLWARVIDMAVLSPALLTLLYALLYVHFFDFAPVLDSSPFDGPSQDEPSRWAWVLVWAAIAALALYEPVMVAWAVLALSAALHQHRRGWHDKLAGTVVVTKASVPARARRLDRERD